ncbi:hypothetical protein O6H91_07G033500 [Diphasiastrum complanatum]|uniref:Uncharacterized protein n=3 Tax=Diphasiastrum complanatum TaxID=34168 RepID=A0ACC2D465_DIPCM|nr:hypothetical protein O6H91_07G033500 [Diphasiastrum complanatum]KAJ7548931.1 hypothetical protein O6H91_07G033500 [Diphasiastrum complanatum]
MEILVNGKGTVQDSAALMSKRLAMLALLARNVSPEKKSSVHLLLSHFAARLDNLALLMKEFERQMEALSSDSLKSVVANVEEQLNGIEKLMDDYTGRCILYLIMCCPVLTNELKILCEKLAKALDGVVKDEFSQALKLQTKQTRQMLEDCSPKMGPKDEALNDSLDEGMLDSIISNTSLCNKLAQQIADSLDMSVGSEEFANELAKLKLEKAGAEQRKGKAHALYLEQSIFLLDKAVAASSKPTNAEKGAASNPPLGQFIIRDTPILPLQSFICPITRDVMRDPVQIASGQTYERGAVEQWFGAGHTRCPMGEELKNTKMKSNFALKQSIAEWRERNYEIRLETASKHIQSADKETRIRAVSELQALCEEEPLNRYRISSKGLLSPLVHLAESKDLELRKKTFQCLMIVAQDNSENQETMVNEGVVDLIVRCLARQYDDVNEAVLLMKLLSGKPNIAEKISHSHGAIVFLVTLLGWENEEIVGNAKAVLENLPTSDENVVMMAEADFLKPLVQRLIEGSTHSKIKMAKALAQMHLPVTSKESIAESGAIATLLKSIDSVNEEEREAAIDALQNLTSVQSICRLLVNLGGLQVLLRLVTAVKSPEKMKTGVALIMANVLTSLGNDWKHDEERETELETLIYTFLQCMGPLITPTIQAPLLRALFGLANGTDTGDLVRRKLIDHKAFTILLPFLRENVMPEVRRTSLQLFSCLAHSYSKEACEALKEDSESIQIIFQILKEKFRNELERAAAARILASLPIDDTEVTSVLEEADVVHELPKLLNLQSEGMEEAMTSLLLRFSSSSVETQLKLASFGVISQLVNLLQSGQSLTKINTAKALSDFSKHSCDLSPNVKPRNCCACFGPRPLVCRLHLGVCHVESSFCLLEANAVSPLVDLLKESDPDSQEAALLALSTLVSDEQGQNWEYGCRAIAKAGGLFPIIVLMSSESQNVQEQAVKMIEQFFRIPEYRERHGAVAQMHIIQAAQRGRGRVRQAAGRILRQLELINSQSNYFAMSN